MQNKLIIALDFQEEKKAYQFIDQVDPFQGALKVGSELFTLLGPAFVRSLVNRGYKVFLDLKYHDIPNTVAQACKVAADLGVWMIDVHAAGGMAMMRAAQQALEPYGITRPLLIAVTVLTSLNESALLSVGIHSSPGDQVKQLAALAKAAQLDGVVCSAHEVPLVKAATSKNFLTVTPGIRLTTDSNDDQVRIVTPEQAIALGSDYLVIGRSLTRATQPALLLKGLMELVDPRR